MLKEISNKATEECISRYYAPATFLLCPHVRVHESKSLKKQSCTTNIWALSYYWTPFWCLFVQCSFSTSNLFTDSS